MSQQTPEQAEATRAGTALQIALAYIGVATIEEALALWDDVNPAKAAATGGRWLSRAVALVMSRRALSRDLTFAYYRLTRALLTGTTVEDPYHPIKSNPTLGDLRRSFAELLATVQDTAPAAPQAEQARRTSARAAGAEPDAGGELGSEDGPSLADELDALIEELAQATADNDREIATELLENIRELEDELERDAEDEAYVNLEALGHVGLERRLSQDRRLDPEEAHGQSGARQAAAAARMAMNGGRATLFNAASLDRRVIGWARVSRTGTPCGFCAMLLSKGFVTRDGKRSGGLYTSAASAGGTEFEEGDLYHDNCNCYAEPIYSVEQFANDPRFDLNRELAEQWPTVTDGYGGRDALNAWRRHIRKRNKELQESPARAA